MNRDEMIMAMNSLSLEKDCEASNYSSPHFKRELEAIEFYIEREEKLAKIEELNKLYFQTAKYYTNLGKWEEAGVYNEVAVAISAILMGEK